MPAANKPAKQVRLRRGTTVQHTGDNTTRSFTGAEGEVTYDSDIKSVRIHDGVTPGGMTVPRSESDGSTKFGNFTFSADGQSLISSHGQANVRWFQGQLQFYDPGVSKYRALGCLNGVPVFGDPVD